MPKLQLTRDIGQTVKIGNSNLTVINVQYPKVKVQLTRQVGEVIGLDEQIKVTIMSAQRKQVRLSIEAPSDVLISRNEASTQR
jgi:carbon storage regulator CsrA